MGPSGRFHASVLSLTIRDFSPMWFLVSMDTGIISIIMNILPWQFHGLGILATIMFTWNVVLFSVFTIISLFRIFKYPKHVKKESTSSIEEMSYLAAPAIAYLTLVSQVILTCSTAWGYGLTVFAYVLWWIGLVWTVALCSGTVIVLIKRPITNDHPISPSIFLPLISVMTLGTTGGLLANYSAGISSAEAVPVIVVSFCCIGYALFLSLLYYAIFMHRLMVTGPPQKPKLSSLIITVGPLGQFATAIQVLGTAASTGRQFASYDEGTWLTASAAATIEAVCVLIALLITGFAFLWISVAWYLIIEALLLRGFPFSMSWWSLIFPMGVFTTSLSNLSIALDSPAFRGLAAALLVFLLIIYFVNLACTLYRVIIAAAFEAPQQQREERATYEEDEEAGEEQDGVSGADTEAVRNDNMCRA